MPCRLCEILRSNILKFDCTSLIPRDDERNSELLDFAFPVYCKHLRGLRLSADEIRLLEWCKSQSLIPIKPALFDVPKPFPAFNKYSMATYDLMHTIEGPLENWASTAGVCLAESGKYHGYKDRYYDNIGRLDSKMSHIPLKHGIPMVLKHFKDGISGIIGLRGNENSKRTSGSGTLGLIDNQDVPQLVLQMILCKKHSA
jgi:hypothetical protein